MKNNFNAAYDLLKNKLYQGHLEQVASEVSLLTPANPREQRMTDHLKGIVNMRKGNFDQAIETFTCTVKENGSNLGVLLDLAASYYLSNQFFNFNLTLSQAQKQMQLASEILSPERKVESFLQLGKFIEEKGDLAEALRLYTGACTISKDRFHESFFRVNFIRSSAQILRMSIQYKMNVSQITEMYNDLLQHSAKDTDFDCEFEVEHALIHAESHLLGLDSALFRLRRLQKNPIMTSYESELIYSDLVYSYLIQNKSVPKILVTELEKIRIKSVQVLTLLTLCEGDELSEQHVNHLSNNVPAALFLRLLIANSVRHTQIDTNQNRILLAVQAQPTLSRKIWMNLIGIGAESTGQTVYYDKASNQLVYQEKPFSFLKQKSFQELIDLLMTTPNISSYDAIRILWNGDGSESDLSRLRMRIHRLNKKLTAFWALPKFIEVDDNKIVLKVDLKYK